jgi:hypothetical protein
MNVTVLQHEDSTMLKGKCLCGEVELEITGALEHQPEACHCTQCRKQSGHFLAAVNVRRKSLIIHGEDKLTWFHSSEKVRRAFCRVCGSTLLWSPTMEGYEFVAVAMGSLEGSTGLRLAKHTFVKDKGDYYAIDDGVAQSVTY